ncbi:MAG: hypothetical protein QHH15_04465 [Candidatus Thermoplasmatota archaeon]|nr:hypothetical protein [Candidatus Thermoplasmatota archaeon]
MLTSGRGKYKVYLERKKIGEDIIYFLGGGEKPHVGAIIICEPGKKTKVIKFKGHYDDIVLKPIAGTACKKYKTKIIAIGGIHIDNATKDEINLLVQNTHNLVKKL